MNAAAANVFLLARILMMSADGTTLLSEHRALVPEGGTGILMENLDIEGFPGSVQIQMSPAKILEAPVPEGSAGAQEPAGTEAPVRVGLRVDLWESAADAAAGRAPRETNLESLDLLPGISGLMQLAEDTGRGRRLVLSLSWLLEPDTAPLVPEPIPAQPARINFRLEVYRGADKARELLESHHLMGLERNPVTWETRWKRPLPRDDGQGLAYRDEGLTLRLLPVLTRSGWISVEASISALLYSEGDAEPLRLSSSATRTVPLGIPFEVSLDLPAEGGGVEPEGAEPPMRSSFIVEVTPYRPGG